MSTANSSKSSLCDLIQPSERYCLVSVLNKIKWFSLLKHHNFVGFLSFFWASICYQAHIMTVLFQAVWEPCYWCPQWVLQKGQKALPPVTGPPAGCLGLCDTFHHRWRGRTYGIHGPHVLSDKTEQYMEWEDVPLHPSLENDWLHVPPLHAVLNQIPWWASVKKWWPGTLFNLW